MQRSAALMAMVLITMTNQSADDVMRHIRAKRPVAFFPEANFDEAIRGYDKTLRKELQKH
jgi:peptidase E